MGRKNSNKKNNPETTSPESGEQLSAAEVEQPAVDPRELFEAYDKAAEELKAAEASLEAFRQRRSDAVKLIGEKLGTGPFGWKGEELSVTTRTEVLPEGAGEKVRYFFKRIKKTVQII